MKTKRLQINYSDTNSYADQETKWVKINNQQEFELNLHQLGWSGNTYGYRFEYYAQTKDLSEVGQIAVTNTFTLNGGVVRGENKFTFKNVGSSQTIHVNGFYNLNVNKSFDGQGGKNDKIKDFHYSLNAGGTTESSANPQLTLKKVDQDNSNLMKGVKFDVYKCELVGDTIKRVSPEMKTSGETVNGIYSIQSSFVTSYNEIYEIKESDAPEGYIKDNSSYYIICVKQENNTYSDYANKCVAYFERHNNKNYKIAYEPKDFNFVIYNSQKGIVVTKAFINDAAGNFHNPVSGTYTFGLYENPEGTGDPLEIIEIKYDSGDTEVKSAKFKNPGDLNKTYYVFELDQNNQPIKASDGEATINSMQYKVVYENDNKTTNSAEVGDTVIVTNKSHTKILPSTGSMGTLIYKLLGATLVVASVMCLLNINKSKSKGNRRKK